MRFSGVKVGSVAIRATAAATKRILIAVRTCAGVARIGLDEVGAWVLMLRYKEITRGTTNGPTVKTMVESLDWLVGNPWVQQVLTCLS